MYAPGHLGIGLLLYTPVAYALSALGRAEEAASWALVVLPLSLLPDVDALLPGVAHRGATHSLPAAGCTGVAVGAVGWLTAPSGDDRSERAAVGFVVGVLSVLGHLLGDVLTPMGVRPFGPGREASYTLDLVPARHPRANVGLLALGAAAFRRVVRR